MMKKCSVPNFEIRRAPIGDIIFCAKFVAHKRSDASCFQVACTVVGGCRCRCSAGGSAPA